MRLYELSLVAKSELGENEVEKLGALVEEVLGQFQSEVVIKDDWGLMQMAQASSNGEYTGRYLYYIFKTTEETNKELTRRLRINEGVMRFGIFKLSENEAEYADVAKRYCAPFSKRYRGSLTDTDDKDQADLDKDRKRFARKKTCWFKARKIRADWKDPATYHWLLNEFGKISPARVTGISCKHQRFATTAIKRARQLGIASNLSNRIAANV